MNIHQIMKSNIEEFSEKIDNSSILILGGTGLFAKELLPKLTYFIDKKEIKTKIYITTRNKKKALDVIPETRKSYIKFISRFLLENEINEDINQNIYSTWLPPLLMKLLINSQISKFIVLRNSTDAIVKIIKKRKVKSTFC